jgi:predicted amidohydrolase
MKDIRAAAVQFNHAAGDKQKNLDMIRTFAAQAHAQKKACKLSLNPSPLDLLFRFFSRYQYNTT